MITADELKRLRALCDAATPGPWEADLDVFDAEEGIVACIIDRPISTIIKIETELRIAAADPWTAEDSQRRDDTWKLARAGQEIKDAQLVAAARNALPRLLDEIERMQAVVEAAKAWRSAGGNPCGEPGCGCTECALFAAVDALLAAERKETP
jgi:hypothetical protein